MSGTIDDLKESAKKALAGLKDKIPIEEEEIDELEQREAEEELTDEEEEGLVEEETLQ